MRGLSAIKGHYASNSLSRPMSVAGIACSNVAIDGENTSLFLSFKASELPREWGRCSVYRCDTSKWRWKHFDELRECQLLNQKRNSGWKTTPTQVLSWALWYWGSKRSGDIQTCLSWFYLLHVLTYQVILLFLILIYHPGNITSELAKWRLILSSCYTDSNCHDVLWYFRKWLIHISQYSQISFIVYPG